MQTISYSTRQSRRARGYTLIEMLLVMGIIILLVTLVLISVNNMLRSSKMNRSVNLIVAAVDEARTAAVTIRREARVDVTPLDNLGKVSRMTVFGPGDSDNFEEYKLPDISQLGLTEPAQDKNFTAAWRTTGKQPLLVSDGSRCMRMRGLTAPTSYWYPGLRVNAVNIGDYYEAILFARIKILPGQQRINKKAMTVTVMNAIDDGGGKAIKSGYGMALKITPSQSTMSRNDHSSLELQRMANGSGTLLAKGDSQDGNASVVIDAAGNPASPTTLLVEGVWYRVMLSVKSYTPEDQGAKPKAIITGKIWADGQLEPQTCSLGPISDTSSPLSNGFGGFSVDNCDVVVDDVLFDMRPVRLIPQGITISPLDPTQGYAYAQLNSLYSFPILFRPDGTTSVFSIIEIQDSSTGDKKYVRIDQNTGRARVAASLDEVKY